MKIVKMFNQAQKELISKAVAGGESKASVARRLGCSADTISRVVKEMEVAATAKMAAAKFISDMATNQPISADVDPVKAAIAKLKSRAESLVVKTDSAIDHLNVVIHGDARITTAAVNIAVADPKKDLIWTMGQNYINIIDDGQTFVANSSHPNFEKARQAIFNGKIEDALNFINVKRGVEKYSQGKIRIENEEVFYGDLKIDTGLTKRIIAAMADGKEFGFLVNFFENLMLNPSRRAVNELFGFLEHNDIELTEDGHFLAWKRVNEDYMDMYSRTIDNSPGKIVSVERNQVDEDSTRTCSAGLHVAAKSYLPHYGGGCGVIIQVKVHPRDVVSIPVDYNNAKMRCARYEVLEDVTEGFSHY